MVDGFGEGPAQMEPLLRAIWFASHKHRYQRRKDPKETAYINHPLEVSKILWDEGDVRETHILQAAVLHDTVEDTDTTFEEIEDCFGEQVARIVRDVTHDERMSKDQRREARVLTASGLAYDSRLVLLADKISNLRDIHRTAPKNWNYERCLSYFHWVRRIVEEIRGTHSGLEASVDIVYHAFLQTRGEN